MYNGKAGTKLTGVGSSVLEGKFEGDLESVVKSLFPGAKRESFGKGPVFYMFDSAASANRSGGAATDERGDETFKATLIYYGSLEKCRDFNVAVTITSQSPALRSEVIQRLVEQAHIKVVSSYDTALSNPNRAFPDWLLNR